MFNLPQSDRVYNSINTALVGRAREGHFQARPHDVPLFACTGTTVPRRSRHSSHRSSISTSATFRQPTPAHCASLSTQRSSTGFSGCWSDALAYLPLGHLGHGPPLQKMQPKCAIFRQKSQQFYGIGGIAPFPDPTPLGRGIPLTTPLSLGVYGASPRPHPFFPILVLYITHPNRSML